jgi:endonuclease YncB( thermonuclease family)
MAMLAILFLLALLAPRPVSSESAWTGRVSLVADGDTMEVQRSGRAVRLRLAGVDAPEKYQPYSNQARKFVAGLCLKRRVTVIPETTDQYGRSVATVLLPDGRNLNEELLKAGLAWHYRHYSANPRLAALEAEARAARRGLWKDSAPIPPWEYRHGGSDRSSERQP